MRNRATVIAISGHRIMFIEQLVFSDLRRIFVGGAIEEGETAKEAALRELMEEANVTGDVLFGPVVIPTSIQVGENRANHIEHVFVVNIGINRPSLGIDPELPADKQELRAIVWADVKNDSAVFNKIDMIYVSAVLASAEEQGVRDDWVDILREGSLKPLDERNS